jgi:hypothetical protein
MKYVLMFCGTSEEQQAFEKLAREDRERAYARIGQWFETNGSKIRGGEEFQPPHTATTVRFGPDRSVVITDGPFVEGKEMVGGWATVEVADLDEALALARTWPGGTAVEVRPVVEH